MFGNNSTSQIQDLWNQGINFSGNAGGLPSFDPNLQGGWSRQAGTGQWVYTAPGTGQGNQFYRQQAPPPDQLGYRPPNSPQPTPGGYGQGGGYNPGAYGGLFPNYGGGYGGFGGQGAGGIRSQYGNSAVSGGGGSINPWLGNDSIEDYPGGVNPWRNGSQWGGGGGYPQTPNSLFAPGLLALIRQLLGPWGY